MPLQKLINHMIEEEQPCISNIIANSGFIFNFFQTALTLAWPSSQSWVVQYRHSGLDLNNSQLSCGGEKSVLNIRRRPTWLGTLKVPLFCVYGETVSLLSLPDFVLLDCMRRCKVLIAPSLFGSRLNIAPSIRLCLALSWLKTILSLSSFHACCSSTNMFQIHTKLQLEFHLKLLFWSEVLLLFAKEKPLTCQAFQDAVPKLGCPRLPRPIQDPFARVQSRLPGDSRSRWSHRLLIVYLHSDLNRIPLISNQPTSASDCYFVHPRFSCRLSLPHLYTLLAKSRDQPICH